MSKISEELDGKDVKAYLYIDRMNEGIGQIKPKALGETFTYSHEFHGDHANDFIVKRIYGIITEIVNVVDLASIDFE